MLCESITHIKRSTYICLYEGIDFVSIRGTRGCYHTKPKHLVLKSVVFNFNCLWVFCFCSVLFSSFINENEVYKSQVHVLCSVHYVVCVLSVAVLVACEDVQITLSCRVFRRFAFQHHHSAKERKIFVRTVLNMEVHNVCSGEPSPVRTQQPVDSRVIRDLLSDLKQRTSVTISCRQWILTLFCPSNLANVTTL